MHVRRAAIAAAFLAAASAGPAAAHPHVYVTGSSELVYDANGAVTAVRHRWTFDEMFSAMASQGLDANGDGTFSREELADLAQINVESLAEFGFFTFLSAGEALAEFDEPVDYWLDYVGDQLTLNFTLPLKAGFAATSKALEFSVYDPSFFVAFAAEKGGELALVDAPSGCAATVTQGQDVDKMQAVSIADALIMEAGEDINFGAEYAGKVVVSCQ